VESSGKALAITVLIAAGVFLSLIAMVVTLNRRDQLVGVNKEIQFDDFAFSVTGIRRAKSLGEGEYESIARGNYYVLSIRIANHAKRISYSFDNKIAVLTDEKGRDFRFSPDGQRALDGSNGHALCHDPIPAGKECIAEVAFDLPDEATPSRLRISSGPVGDLLEFVFFGTRRIDLSAARAGSSANVARYSGIRSQFNDHQYE